jgi:plastocyanin
MVRLSPLLLVGILMVACGDDGNQAATAPSPTPPAPTTTSPRPAPPEPECIEGTELEVEAENLEFDVDCIRVPADTPFTIAFSSKDDDLKHDIAIGDNVYDLQPSVFDGKVIGGDEDIMYEIEGVPMGEYVFFCSVHRRTMNGDFIAE